MAVIKDDAPALEGHELLSLEDASNPGEPSFRAECACGYPGFTVQPEARMARAEWAAHREAARAA